MFTKKLLTFLVIILCFNIPAFCAIGQSAVIALSFPYGARHYGMGEVGAALADDESALYWNPAGLGIYNERWQYGSYTIFYEPLLPAFDIPDLWHGAIASCYQPKYLDIGGFGFFINYLNFGENEEYDPQGHFIRRFNSYEFIIGIAWGFNFADIGWTENLNLGIGIKYAHSALAPGIGEGSEGVGRTFAIDAGLLYCFPFGFRIGFTLQNMGPSVFYISKDNADPIPFTGRLAFGYKKEFIINNLRKYRFCAEFNIDKEMVKNKPYKQPDPWYKAIVTSWIDEPMKQELSEIITNIGSEITFFNTGSFRI
jgi:hypothetical protein